MRNRTVIACGLLLAGWLWVPGPAVAEDFLDSPKSDANIKPFVFPKSMKVMQSCTAAEFCLHHTPEVTRGQKAYAKDLGMDPLAVNRVFADKTPVKRTLMKIDPARLAPLTLGDDLHRPVNRGTLLKLGEQYDEDILLIYRAGFSWHPDNPHILLQGLLYLTKQKKVLALSDVSHGVEYGLPHPEETLGGIYFSLLEQMEDDARRILHAHKYEKRRSNY